MKFVEQEKTGRVLGNFVRAKPVPFGLVAKIGRAQKSGDAEQTAMLMAETVSACVTMEDGSPVDANEISQNAVVELFKFATDSEATASDFTPAR